MSTTEQPALRTYITVYLLLLVGLVATVAVAFVPLGSVNLMVAMTIAFAKATLVVLFFMHVLYSPKLTWMAVVAGLVWLSILLALVSADYLTRAWLRVTPIPGELAVPLENFQPPRDSSSTGIQDVPHATE
jgi:cytochrome c oxidase subunit 4